MNSQLDIFGNRTWETVRRSLLRRAHNKWPGMQPADIEDAVSTAVLDLVDYWVTLPSSVTEDVERNYAYAIYRGTRVTNAALGGAAEFWDKEDSLEFLESLENDDHESHYVAVIATTPFENRAMVPRPPHFQESSAEDTLVRHGEYERIQGVMAGISDKEFDSWFADFWTGDSLVNVAARRGEDASAVRMRRNRGLARLAANAA